MRTPTGGTAKQTQKHNMLRIEVKAGSMQITVQVEADLLQSQLLETMTNNNEFDFRGWFDKEVEQLEKDPEYIAYGLMVELESTQSRKTKAYNAGYDYARGVRDESCLADQHFCLELESAWLEGYEDGLRSLNGEIRR